MSSLIFSIPRIPLTPSSILHSILLCLFLIIFLRIVYFTLSCASPYSTTTGLSGSGSDSDTHPPNLTRREMLARGPSFVGFSTITSPGTSRYIPDMRWGGGGPGSSGAGRTNAPLLMAHDGHDEPLVELDAFSRDAPDQDQLGNLVAVHGTNALNTSWGWMV